MDFFHACKNGAIEIVDLIKETSHTALCAKRTIGFGGDTTREIDFLAEGILLKHLQSFGAMFSEESGVMGEGEISTVVDPLDGSDNFVSQIPYYGFSVALVEGDTTKAGFVVNLATQQFIYRGDGDVVEGYISSDEAFRLIANPYATLGVFEKGYAHGECGDLLFQGGDKFRVMGALALSVAGAYHYDFVIFKGQARIFDVAAALFIVKDLEIRKTDDYLIVTHTIQKANELEAILQKGLK
jgi:myo-inositol-1(or 4)-monophosphatase